MSFFYVKDNSEGARDTFNKKMFYKLDTFSEEYPNLVDFTFAEKQLYGRVSRFFEPIIVYDYILKLKPIKQTAESGKNFQALNFVADAFKDLAGLFAKKAMRREIDTSDKFLTNLSTFKAYQSPKRLYTNHLNEYRAALETLFQEDDVKFVMFEKFIALLMPYLLQTTRKRPFTLPAFIKSHYCPATVSGLVIEISDTDPSNDEEKMDKFYGSNNWQFFLNACAAHGFMVDQNIPWRLVADIGSAPMLEYARQYGITDSDAILRTAYQKAHKPYFRMFKNLLFNLYNQLKQTRYYETVLLQNDGKKVVTREPIEYSPTEFFEAYDDFYFLDLYCKIRLNEEEGKFSSEQQERIIDNCIELCKLDFEIGLDSFENILNKTFDYIGSLTYISKRLKEISRSPQPNDSPDVQMLSEPIEEILPGGDGAMDAT
jgi:hypothetical protein